MKNLPYPYSWENRRPLIKGGVLYLPDHYQPHERDLLPPFSSLFGNTHPVHLEYCSGNGEWIVTRALETPKINWIGVEKAFDRVRKIYAKAHHNALKNLFIVAGEALLFSSEYLRDQSIDSIYVNFPDPWPKNRHAKRRLIQEPFPQELWRTLKKGGELTLVTDHLPYLNQMQREMQKWPQKRKDFSSYGSSHFQQLCLKKGLDIHYLHYQRLTHLVDPGPSLPLSSPRKAPPSVTKTT